MGIIFCIFYKNNLFVTYKRTLKQLKTQINVVNRNILVIVIDLIIVLKQLYTCGIAKKQGGFKYGIRNIISGIFNRGQ